MKRIIFAFVLLIAVTAANAQYEKKDKKAGGFKKENLFTGGGITASFYSGGTVLGVSPVLGYSINKFIDAGVVANFTYTGIRQYSGDKYRQFVYGPGAFAKIYPVDFLFVQGTFEHNFIAETYKPAYGGATEKYNVQANSFLIGGGYCSGREGVGSLFYYLSVMVDIVKDHNSPYVELLQDGSYRALPVIKAGLQIPLFQGGSNRRRD
jgi:hypothetical protein